MFKDPEKIKFGWKDILRELEEIVEDYNDSVTVRTFTNSPLRVWGEVKRHRTLRQSAEPIYHAIERARKTLEVGGKISDVVSIPQEVRENQELFNQWVGIFSDSINAYQEMIASGVRGSEILGILPRGIKVGIVKSYDLYNLTTGYMSLRLCTTAEPEMKATTVLERGQVRGSHLIPNYVKDLIDVKCAYTGFCPDRNCGIVQKFVPEYTKEVHADLKAQREQEIRARL